MVAPIVGGIVIGLSAAALLLLNGRIAGVSGIIGGLLKPRAGDALWRALFVGGLIAGGVLLRFTASDPFHGLTATSPGVLIAAGLMVGFGASLGSGCTSGHGVCGVGRLSPRSIIATVAFMMSGAVTVFIARHVIGVAS